MQIRQLENEKYLQAQGPSPISGSMSKFTNKGTNNKDANWTIRE